MTPITVVQVEDEEPMHEWMRDKVADTEIRIVAQTTSGEEGIRQILNWHPTVAVVDIQLDPVARDAVQGHEVLKRVLQSWPSARILVHTKVEYYEFVPGVLRRFLEDGARGIIFKHVRSAEVIAAIRAVALGDLHVPASVWQRIVDSDRDKIDWQAISPLMRQIGAYLPLEYSYRDIARALQAQGLRQVNEGKVRDNLAALYRHFHVEGRVKAALMVHALQKIGEWDMPRLDGLVAQPLFTQE